VSPSVRTGLDDGLFRATAIDLSYPLSPAFPLFPVYDPVEVAERFNVAAHGFFVRRWSFDEHCGTHVDAPAHFAEDGATVDLIPTKDLFLRVAVVDVRERAARDDDAVVLPNDILRWERSHGRLPDRTAVFALTGWGSRASDRFAYLNADASGVLHFPGFGVEATEFLKSERPQVRAIGLDTGSLDPGAAQDFPAHVSWLPSGRYGVENLANLERLPPAGAVVVVGAPKLGGGSGGPARIFALVS
jgi:kynurenine formamidase